MSILQDLDPQYAKLHKQPLMTPKAMTWMGVLLLVLGSVYWFATDRPVRKEAAEVAPSLRSTAPGKNSGTDGVDAKKEIPVAGSELPAPPLANNSATINASVPAPRLASEVVQENARTSLPDAEYRRQKPAAATSDKALKQVVQKNERRNGSNQSPNRNGNEKKQPGSNKPMQERDEDIITAIVR